jgi:hypothetical protein
LAEVLIVRAWELKFQPIRRATYSFPAAEHSEFAEKDDILRVVALKILLELARSAFAGDLGKLVPWFWYSPGRISTSRRGSAMLQPLSSARLELLFERAKLLTIDPAGTA